MNSVPLSDSASSGHERYVFIDALRGIACLGVLAHHLLFNEALGKLLRTELPTLLAAIAFCGTFGVQIFFVLSGFVIAHSLRHLPLDARTAGSFILRRQIRLDPPYWIMIAITLLLHGTGVSALLQDAATLPSWQTVALNAIYLQRVTGVEHLIMVGWTLCMEVQFYLLFILLLALTHKLAGAKPLLLARLLNLVVFGSGLISLVLIHAFDWAQWYLPWFYFAAGVLCYRTLHQVCSRRMLFSFLGLMGLSVVVFHWSNPGEGFFAQAATTVGLLSCLAIYKVGAKGRLTTLWDGRIIQYFGRISYSLYLVHWAVIVTVYNFGRSFSGDNVRYAFVYLVLATLLSVAAAHLLYLTVEKPSMLLAARFRSETKKKQQTETGYESGFGASVQDVAAN